MSTINKISWDTSDGEKPTGFAFVQCRECEWDWKGNVFSSGAAFAGHMKSHKIVGGR